MTLVITAVLMISYQTAHWIEFRSSLPNLILDAENSVPYNSEHARWISEANYTRLMHIQPELEEGISTRREMRHYNLVVIPFVGGFFYYTYNAFDAIEKNGDSIYGSEGGRVTFCIAHHPCGIRIFNVQEGP